MWKEASLLFFCGSLSAAGTASAQTVAIYWQDEACALMELGMGARVAWCAEKLVVTAKRRLELVVSWKLSGFPGGTLEKGSDTGNENMYLVDNMGNRYDHVATRGAAANGGNLSDDRPVLEGVFVFPPPRRGARQFKFVDDDQHVAIPGITASEQVRSDRARSAHVLGRLRRTSSIDIDYRWEGPNGSGQEEYALRLTAGGFLAEGVVDGTPAILPVWQIPSFDVDAFLGMLAQSPIIERDVVPKMEPSDHRRSIRIELQSGRDTIVFSSESRGLEDIAWMVEADGGLYIVPDDTPGRALQMLDRHFGRDLASRARKYLSPHVGEGRALVLWTELEGQLGTEHAYKIAYRLQELLGNGEDEAVWQALERYLESKRRPTSP